MFKDDRLFGILRPGLRVRERSWGLLGDDAEVLQRLWGREETRVQADLDAKCLRMKEGRR